MPMNISNFEIIQREMKGEYFDHLPAVYRDKFNN